VVIREIGLSSYRSIERRRASGTETQHTNPTRPPLKGGEGEAGQGKEGRDEGTETPATKMPDTGPVRQNEEKQLSIQTPPDLPSREEKGKGKTR